MAKHKIQPDANAEWLSGYDTGHYVATKEAKKQNKANSRILTAIMKRQALRHRWHIVLAVIVGQLITIAAYFVGRLWL